MILPSFPTSVEPCNMGTYDKSSNGLLSARIVPRASYDYYMELQTYEILQQYC